uniref:RING-type E3 ubiquitin transferase n=1 Tax=Plectus sambesii TaxID=2011161 RepID=A0A914W2Z1_9BILA
MAVSSSSSPPRTNASNPSAVDCRVCHEKYTLSGAKVPRLLHGCGHTICHGCVSALISQQAYSPVSMDSLSSMHLTILCPFDRTPTILMPEQGGCGLNKNFALVELIENVHANQSGEAQQSESGEVAEAEGTASVVDVYSRERLLGIPCDEDASHIAVVYCVVCESQLCSQCSDETHKTKVLHKHRRVPLSEKPHPRQKCPFHSAYALEFVCQETDCGNSDRLMCLLCRDYGRHQNHRHSLLETEAAQLREQMVDGLTEFRRFTADLLDWGGRVGRAVTGLMDATDGSAVTAKRLVSTHFAELRDQLALQEATALSIVEGHARERLALLRQQQEDLATVTSQVSAVCTQLDKSEKLDDARLVVQQTEIVRMLEMVRKQRIEFTDLPNQLLLDSRIPLAFTKDNRVHIGPNVEMRVVLLGLDGAGKTTVVFKLKNNEIMPTVSTIGFNVETLEYKNLKLTLWDVGGLPKLRPLWKHYYLNTQALIFVIDSSDRERFPEVQSELVKILSENDLREASLLILANKQDQPGRMNCEEMVQALTLSKLCYGRSWHVQPCDALTGEGLWDGLDWLTRQLLSNTVSPSSVHNL